MRLRIDPGRATAGVVDLFPVDGEYARVIAGLRAAARLDVVPRRHYIELYTYEFVERVRERMLSDGWRDEQWSVPFWPPSVFSTLDTSAHGGVELMAMLPPVVSAVVAIADPDATARAAQSFLGPVILDAATYHADLSRRAAAGGWTMEKR